MKTIIAYRRNDCFVLKNMRVSVVKTSKSILHYLFWETKYILHDLMNDIKLSPKINVREDNIYS